MIRCSTVLITGGREFRDETRIHRDIRLLTSRGLQQVVHGDCPSGADHFVQRYPGGLPPLIIPCAVDEQLDGRWPAAGNKRNERMIETYKPDIVLAYPDAKSVGTWNCVQSALFRGISVAVYHENLLCQLPQGGHYLNAHGAFHMPEVGPGGFGAAYIPGVNKARRTYYIAKAVWSLWPAGVEFRKKWREYRRLLLDQAVDDPPEFNVSRMPAVPDQRYASGFAPGRETDRWTFQRPGDREYLCDEATEADARRKAWAWQNERDARGEM